MSIIRAPRLIVSILAAGFLVDMMGPLPVEAGYIDAINPGAAPEPSTNIGGSLSDFGWYYTPTLSYSLTGISTFFEPINFGSGSRTITFQIQTDRPVNGGTILGQAGVTADSATGGVVGASFSPVTLTAGTTYFVDLLNLNGMGVDLGQWADVGGQHVATAGATTRLDAFYLNDTGSTSFSTVRVGDAADESNANGTASGLEPILFFSGTPLAAVPEPSSLLMVATGIAGLGLHMRRRA